MDWEEKNRLFLLKLGVLLAEAVNATSRVQETLLARKEGVASGADFHMHLLALGGQDMFLVAAGTSDGGVVNLGMNIFFHNLPRCSLPDQSRAHIRPDITVGAVLLSPAGIPDRVV